VVVALSAVLALPARRPVLAETLPTVLTGFLAPIVGLTLAANVYGVAVIVMALVSMLAIVFSRGKR